MHSGDVYDIYGGAKSDIFSGFLTHSSSSHSRRLNDLSIAIEYQAVFLESIDFCVRKSVLMGLDFLPRRHVEC
jgi:hypothetical protein